MPGTTRLPRLERAGPLLRAVADVLTSVTVARGLGLVKGVVVAALLGPADYGVATIVAIVVAYSGFADFGGATGASRDLSLSIGRGDLRAATVAARHLCALRVAAGGVAGAVAFGASWLVRSGPSRLGLLAAFPVAVASSVVAAGLLRWQAEGKARQLARGTLAHSLLDASLVILLTRLFGLRGLLSALFIAPVIAAFWIGKQRAFVIPALPGRSILRRYLQVGIPWLALALVEHNLVYVDHFLVLGIFGVRELGVYNVALVVSDVHRMFGLAVGIVLAPRLLQAFAAHGAAVERLRGLTLTPVHLLAATMPFLVPPLYFGAKGGLLAYYPRYADAIPIIGLLLLGSQFLVLNNGVSSFLLAVGKQGRGAVIAVLAIAFDATVAVALARQGGDLRAVAWASLAGFVFFALFNLAYVHCQFRSSLRDRLVFFPGLY